MTELADYLQVSIATALVVGSLAVLSKLVGFAWVRGLFESEGEPSIRLVMATTITIFTLFMQAANRLSDNQVEANYFFAGTLYGMGVTKLIATRFANRTPTPDVKVTNTDSVNVNSPTNATS